jgi:hypothetical protein
MPDIAALTAHITSFATLAGVVFLAGITLSVGKIGWRVAKGYFFSGSK